MPETLHHDAFHGGNIFVRDGRYTFAVWGESCAAHPFFTLVVTLRSIVYRLELAEGSPELAGLRDACLEPWTHYASREPAGGLCAGAPAGDGLPGLDLAPRRVEPGGAVGGGARRGGAETQASV